MSDASAPAATAVAEFGRYLRTGTTGGIILVVATAIALIWVNSPLGDVYRTIRDFELGPHFLHLNLSLGYWAKDGLLAIVFFVAGLELIRELVVGELSKLKQATLPIIAAIGGMVVPGIAALSVGWGSPGIGRAWSIPVATDIAFALGGLALTASNLPSGPACSCFRWRSWTTSARSSSSRCSSPRALTSSRLASPSSRWWLRLAPAPPGAHAMGLCAARVDHLGRGALGGHPRDDGRGRTRPDDPSPP